MARVRFERVILIVLDGVGIGALPDASRYGDAGSDTLGNIARRVSLHVPTLQQLGLWRLVPAIGFGSVGTPRRGVRHHTVAHALPPDTSGGYTSDRDTSRGDSRGVAAAYGRMAEASPGKDSVTGHWEIAGLVLDRAFPTFPQGFPLDVIAAFEARIGRGTLGNVVASGTEVIEVLGPEHLRTGAPIVYTSADSVFQIAAHEDVVPVADLYHCCEAAYDLVSRGMGVARVIARPFVGTPGRFTRTSRRKDYALPPHAPTLLDRLTEAGHPVTAIGKISDLFAGRAVTHHQSTASDDEGMDAVERAMGDVRRGLVWANLVDFDQRFGHRNDVEGYARNLERFDARLAELLALLGPGDLLVITADHGNDPTTLSTDHSREYVPLLAAGVRVRPGVNLGTRATFADLGQTIADNFGVTPLAHGTSFLSDLLTARSASTPYQDGSGA